MNRKRVVACVQCEMHSSWRLQSLLCSLVVLLVLGCSPPEGEVATATPKAGAAKDSPADRSRQSPQLPEKLTLDYLPNSVQVHPKVISGGQPDGEKGFAALESLGVKTVISVDGAKPDIETAKRHGIRYVHLPHGYNGIPQDRVYELAKAVRELPGPIYIHCHHGKHRSPAAAAIACVAAGMLDPARATSVLKLAGTNEHYRGLYSLSKTVQPIDRQTLERLQVDFKELASIPPLAEAMIQLEHTHDHLKRVAAADWKAPADHPDIDPVHEALLLREHFTEIVRAEATAKEPLEMKALFVKSESAARELEAALKLPFEAEMRTVNAASAFEHVTQLCSTCHGTFRDVPIDEK